MENFTSEHKGKVAVVRSNVEKLDSTNAPELKSLFIHLNKASNNKLVLDLSSTKYCDSSGLSAILTGNRLWADNGNAFVLTGLVHPSVKMLVSISRLDSVLTIKETLGDATKYVMLHAFKKEIGGGEDE